MTVFLSLPVSQACILEAFFSFVFHRECHLFHNYLVLFPNKKHCRCSYKAVAYEELMCGKWLVENKCSDTEIK